MLWVSTDISSLDIAMIGNKDEDLKMEFFIPSTAKQDWKYMHEYTPFYNIDWVDKLVATTGLVPVTCIWDGTIEERYLWGRLPLFDLSISLSF
jgi:hypothetical protein